MGKILSKVGLALYILGLFTLSNPEISNGGLLIAIFGSGLYIIFGNE